MLLVVILSANIWGMQTIGSRQNYWKMERNGAETSDYLWIWLSLHILSSVNYIDYYLASFWSFIIWKIFGLSEQHWRVQLAIVFSQAVLLQEHAVQVLVQALSSVSAPTLQPNVSRMGWLFWSCKAVAPLCDTSISFLPSTSMDRWLHFLWWFFT